MMYVSSFSPIQSAWSQQTGLGIAGQQTGAASLPNASYNYGLSANPALSGFVSPIGMQNLAYAWSPLGATGGGLGLTGRNTITYSFNPAFTLPQQNFLPMQQVMAMGAPLTTGGYNVIQAFGMTQPRVEINETNSDVVITAELPNINVNDLYLTATDDSISISATALAGNNVTSLHRTIALPTTVKAEQVEASYSNGILEARLPKADVAARRKVRVNVVG